MLLEFFNGFPRFTRQILIVSLLDSSIVLCSAAYASDPPKNLVDAFNTGISEKGLYIGISKNLSERDQFEFGLNYVEADYSSFVPGYVNDEPVNLSNQGLQFSYKRHLFNSLDQSGFYLKLSGDLSYLSISSSVDLTKETYKLDNLDVKCSACGNLSIETDPSQLVFIPSLSLGYQSNLSDQLKVHFGLGIQYVDLPDITWNTDTEYPPPSFVGSKIDELVNDINSSANEISKYLPTAFVSLSYHF